MVILHRENEPIIRLDVQSVIWNSPSSSDSLVICLVCGMKWVDSSPYFYYKEIINNTMRSKVIGMFQKIEDQTTRFATLKYHFDG